jgi:hypothetical protein
MLYVRHGNYSKYFLKRCLNVVIQPTDIIYAVIPGKRRVINKYNHGTRRVPSCSKPPQVLEDCSPFIRERTPHFPINGKIVLRPPKAHSDEPAQPPARETPRRDTNRDRRKDK